MRVLEPHDPVATFAIVLDALPIVAYMARPDGTLSYVSRGYAAQTGVATEAIVGLGLLDFVQPAQRDRVLSGWADARERGEAYRDEFELRHADGLYRWVTTHAEPMRGDDGQILSWFGTIVDIDDRRRAEALLATRAAELSESEGRYRAFSDALPGMTWSATPAGDLEFVGERWSATRGKPADAALGDGWMANVYPEDRDEVRACWQTALTSGNPYEAQFRVRMADGQYRWQLVRAQPQRDADGAIVRWIGVNVDIDDQRRSDESYRAERGRIEAGLRLLAQSGAVVLDSLSYRATLQNIARAFVNGFAAYCIIDIADPASGPQRTVAHRDAELMPVIRDLPTPASEHPIARAIEHGESCVTVLDDRWNDHVKGGPERASAVRRLDVRSFITVPVVTPSGVVAGALTCALDGKSERQIYVEEDIGFVREVGRRAGAAIANALSYERERRIAVELQSASLPVTLPVIDHLLLDADYRPGSDEATIGGDWYDAFALEDGRVAITVGDVVGHGLHAAVTMSKLRQAMQSAAMIAPDPCVMLTVADRTLRLIDPDGFATAFAAIYDPNAHTIVFASAGHPPPIIRYADGRIEEIGGAGMMLGLRGDADAPAVVFRTPPDSTIVFYTDGLIEATRDIAHGQARLTEALRRPGIVLSPHPAHAIVEHVLDGRAATDDIAVLVAHLRPPNEPAANPEVQTTYADAEMHGDAEAG